MLKERMDYKNIFYPESQFGGFTDSDGTIAFYTRVNSLVHQLSTVLDIGCGRGSYIGDPITIRRELRIFKGKCQKIIGIDRDQNAVSNQFLDEFRLITDTQFPIEDESIDLAFCDSVLEHVENYDLFFSECQRVLKYGGFLCVRTSNILHYVGLISKVIPNKLHINVLKLAQDNAKQEDIFPTYYKCNTVSKLHRTLSKYGFNSYVYGFEPEPGYLSFSRFFYRLGVMYQRISPKMFRGALFAFGKKCSSP